VGANRFARNIPNVLTLARLVFAPVVAGAILTGNHVTAIRLFVIAGLTDTFDGTLARRWNAMSAFGAYLDPIADKTLLSGVYLALAVTGAAPRWLAILVLGRDVLLLMASAIAYNFTKLRKFPPSVWGKLTTLLQIVSAIAWMAHNAWPAPVLGMVAEGLLWPTAAATVGSGAHYIWRGWRTMR
jgi:cardiolipin synthase